MFERAEELSFALSALFFKSINAFCSSRNCFNVLFLGSKSSIALIVLVKFSNELSICFWKVSKTFLSSAVKFFPPPANKCIPCAVFLTEPLMDKVSPAKLPINSAFFALSLSLSTVPFITALTND